MIPRIAAVGRQQSRALGATLLAGKQNAGSNLFSLGCAGAVVAAVVSMDSPTEMTYGPIANIEDIKALQSRISDLEADIAYPGRTTNSAFVFVKPAALTPQTVALVQKQFDHFGIRVTNSGVIDAKTIDKEQLIDTHYGAIAHKAMNLKAYEYNVSEKAQADFKKAFGLDWKEAVDRGMVYNALEGCQKMGVSGDQMDKKYWSKLQKGKNLIKFGGGFYCGQLAPEVFVINGFYMAMRSVFTTPPAKIHWFTVEWPSSSISWEDFRGKVLGATDPKTAEEGSVRREIFNHWKDLKLKEEPNVGDNGVHASASPFEALTERINWLGVTIETDAFGSACIGAGIPSETIALWGTDPAVEFEGKTSSLFDLLEDIDSKDCLKKMLKIQGK